MSTPLGQVGEASSTRPSDVEMIESQLMNSTGATLPNHDMGVSQAPRMDPGALPIAMPQVTFPAPAPMHGGQYLHVPPAVPPPHRGALDEYAFPVSLFIITIIVLSPYIGALMKRFLPPSAQNVWITIGIKAAMVTAGFVMLDKLNQ